MILAEDAELCPPDNVQEYGDHFYVVNEDYMSKIAAITACEELGRVVETVTMIMFIKSLINEAKLFEYCFALTAIKSVRVLGCRIAKSIHFVAKYKLHYLFNKFEPTPFCGYR